MNVRFGPLSAVYTPPVAVQLEDGMLFNLSESSSDSDDVPALLAESSSDTASDTSSATSGGTTGSDSEDYKHLLRALDDEIPSPVPVVVQHTLVPRPKAVDPARML